MSGDQEPGRGKRSQQNANLPDSLDVPLHPGNTTARLRAALLREQAGPTEDDGGAWLTRFRRPAS